MIEFENYSTPRYTINGGKDTIVGSSDGMINLFRYLNRLADLPTTVLLLGETGTGKELCAKALHYNGKGDRNKHNFVAVNCAGLPAELLESELFGYVRGAFTGAHRDVIGKFQYAHHGTILLDEIGDMSLSLQTKILRVLQERQVTRVGSNRTEEIDVRIIAATNRDLEKEVERGNFREDLYYRLNVVPLIVPPLRERGYDVLLLAEYFIEKHNLTYKAQIEGLSAKALEKLHLAEWKGNVRELEHTLERVFIFKNKGIIEAEDLFNSGRRLMLVNSLAFKAEKKEIILPKDREEVQRSTEEKVLIEPPVSIVELDDSPIASAAKSNGKNSNPLWYQKGILPISLQALSEIEGAKPYHIIYERLNGKKIYVEQLGAGTKHGRILLFLTPVSLPIFFEETNAAEYRRLEEKIRTTGFNQLVSDPFKFFSLPQLLAHDSSFRNVEGIRRAAEDAGVYTVSVGNTSGFALTEDNASYFVPRGSRQEKVDQLREEIISGYSAFKNWRPE
ncbi:sigma-54-dependent Fis family transcriptional regulator [Candidatus Woesearchaeota archaeon]|nr:sigma-54-dependent Fis family transcriptional regulator [Candidatus Woesearchaeota archaeon]